MRQRQRIKGARCFWKVLFRPFGRAPIPLIFFVVIEFQTCTAALDSPCETNQLSTLNTNVDSLRRRQSPSFKSPYLQANVERVPTILSAYRMAPKNIYCDIFNPVHRDVPCVPPLQQSQKSNLLHSGSDRSVDFPSPHPTVSTPVEKILLVHSTPWPRSSARFRPNCISNRMFQRRLEPVHRAQVMRPHNTVGFDIHRVFRRTHIQPHLSKTKSLRSTRDQPRASREFLDGRDTSV
jgi:hypothetical protein